MYESTHIRTRAHMYHTHHTHIHTHTRTHARAHTHTHAPARTRTHTSCGDGSRRRGSGGMCDQAGRPRMLATSAVARGARTETDRDWWKRLGIKLFSGGGASVISKTAVAPFERCKLLLQTRTMGSGGIVATIGRVIREQGGAALWRGNAANCARVFRFIRISEASGEEGIDEVSVLRV